MDSLVRNGPYSNKLLLNAIYLQSSLYSDRTCLRLNSADPQSRGMAYYNRFKVLLADYVDKPTIPTVVALLTCGACLVPRGMQSAGWIFCGIGYRMLTDIGCHLDVQTVALDSSNYRASAIDLELRKRVYWGAYVGDMLQSLFLGRSPTMPEVHGTVSREYFDSHEELEEWKPYNDPLIEPLGMRVSSYQPRPSYALSTFQSLLRLCDIMGRVIRAFYSTSSAETSEETLLEERDRVREQLLTWKAELPGWLQFEPGVDITPPPHQITPHAIFWTLIILTEQAFLNRGHFAFSLSVESKREAEEKCLNAAFRIWKLVEVYKHTFTLRRAQYGISYASYCAVVVILQQTGQDSEEHINCIRFFWLALLEYQRGCNYGLKRPLKLLKSLMLRLEKVAQNIDMEEPADEIQNLLDLQADLDSVFNSMFNQGSTMNSMEKGGCDLAANFGALGEDTNFGTVEDSVFGFCSVNLGLSTNYHATPSYFNSNAAKTQAPDICIPVGATALNICAT
ncbi:Nitrogen assimilation transcription factor nit-4 [Colletotrichum siamense]|uniref:Nitrogen assimilation transcription factor nit-4 n=1 Tax=Colletotrichum siamense TaxID=690259 RepID=UPI001872EABF|nr:Nitrogen assimilation transcription factor nit-4 [Colletotrichum siamense]KAF5501228.1 Nitrogen assimilation transcription factor nit-4 [Colletotrichum siamense]